jgi:hypothetical protein
MDKYGWFHSHCSENVRNVKPCFCNSGNNGARLQQINWKLPGSFTYMIWILAQWMTLNILVAKLLLLNMSPKCFCQFLQIFWIPRIVQMMEETCWKYNNMLTSCITKRDCNTINYEHWKNKAITSFYNWESIFEVTKKEHNKDSRGMIEKTFYKGVQSHMPQA